MKEKRHAFSYEDYILGPDEVKSIIQYPRRANVRTIRRRLSRMGIIVDPTYDAVVLDPKKSLVVVRGIGTVDAIRAIQKSGSGIKFSIEARLLPA